MASSKDIKYLGKTFDDFRAELIEFTKNYFPNSYNDFSAASPGIMFMEMASYVGDVLSYYQDKQIQETFIEHAKNPANLYSLAYMMGYKPKVSTASQVVLTATQEISAINGEPNWQAALDVGENTQVRASSRNNTNFILNKGVNFRYSSSFDPTTIEFNETTNTYTLTKTVTAFSAEQKTATFQVPIGERFPTFLLEDSNLLGVVSIVDGNGVEWKEVPYLGQDTIYKEELNPNYLTDRTEANLLLTRVDRRFVTRFTSTGILQIQFGGGGLVEGEETFLPDPKKIGLNTQSPIQDLDKFYDPSNFLYTGTYGTIPSGNITVTYLVGGGLSSNEQAGAIDINVGSINLTNLEPATGGKDGDTIQEIRENSLRAFNEQGRVVTLKDYTARALSMPAKYGVISKVYATVDDYYNTDSSRVILYVLSSNSEGKLIPATQAIKNNLSNYLYQYLPIGSSFEIRDAFIVNIAVDFEVIPLPNYIGKEVKARCIQALQDYFLIDKWSINQPINLNPIYTILDRVKGVQSIEDINVRNLSGGDYSTTAYDLKVATRKKVVYPSIDPCIFEVKFPNRDIRGRITTL